MKVIGWSTLFYFRLFSYFLGMGSGFFIFVRLGRLVVRGSCRDSCVLLEEKFKLGRESKKYLVISRVV